MSEVMTGAARYRELMASRAPVVVKVKLPSGFVQEMQKPNAFGFILNNELPQNVASDALEAWQKDGVGVAEDDLKNAPDSTKIDVFKKIIDIRNKTLELSHEPKLVIGEAKPDTNELSVSEMDDTDLAFLFKWVAAGGDASVMLAMFPEGREQRVMAGINSKKLRKTRKQFGKS